ncbi:MAG TPA: TonB family protein [Thermoanaerobaculia bacterium]|nr:TonB family protein [Thermoanaerobaculia bacterium]
MRRLAVLPIVLLFACGEKTEPFLQQTDTRAPIATRYVTGPELPVRQSASEDAPVMVTYQSGERVSVLAEQGEWVEVRVGDRSGWARKEFVGTAAETGQEGDDITVRFQKTPPSVTNLTATGEVYIEADVNTDGDVVNTRVLHNSTGSEALAAQNEAALRQAKFYPIVKNGERQPFKYYHRVTY